MGLTDRILCEAIKYYILPDSLNHFLTSTRILQVLTSVEFTAV